MMRAGFRRPSPSPSPSPGRTITLPGGIRCQLIGLELIAKANVEDTGHDRVDPVLRVSVWHQLHAGGHFDPDHVGARLGGMTDGGGEANRGRERRERLPFDALRPDRSENGLVWLVGSDHW